MKTQKIYNVQARKTAINEMRRILNLDTAILQLIYGDEYEQRIMNISRLLDKFEAQERERKARWIEEHLPF